MFIFLSTIAVLSYFFIVRIQNLKIVILLNKADALTLKLSAIET